MLYWQKLNKWICARNIGSEVGLTRCNWVRWLDKSMMFRVTRTWTRRSTTCGDCWCTGDSEYAKAVFLDSVLRAGDDSTLNSTSLQRVLPLCSPICPVNICYGDKQHYVVRVSGARDPVVLENEEAVEQMTKQICTATDSECIGRTMTWITIHLPFHLLQVTTL